MLYYQTVDARTLELLKFLQQIPELSTTRLVGGTALALQFGHRISVDIDLFGYISVTGTELQVLLAEFAPTTILRDSKQVHTFLVDGIKVDIVNYKYVWIDAPVIEENIVMASIKDIAAMKLAAIAGRGAKKDFYDLYLLLQHTDLASAMHFYTQKYTDGSPFLVVKSMVYFDDADQDEQPILFEMPTWEVIKNYIVTQHRLYLSVH